MEKREKITNKTNYVHIIMWIVFLCFFALFAVNGFTYAQYLTNGDNADVASIAKLYVNSPNTDSISVDFHGSSSAEKTIPFQIVNFNENVANEVLLDYSIRVVNEYGNLPLEYKLTCTNVNGGVDVNSSDGFFNSSFEWTGGKLLASTHCTHNYTLIIRWASGQYDAETFANEIDLIKIIIDSEQMD